MAVLAAKNPKRYTSRRSRNRMARSSAFLSARQRAALEKRVKAYGATNIDVCMDEIKSIEFITGKSSNGKD